MRNKLFSYPRVIALLLVAIGIALAIWVSMAKATSLPNIQVGYYTCNGSNICTSYDASGATIGTGGSAGVVPLPTGFGSPQVVWAHRAETSGSTSSYPYIRISGMSGSRALADGSTILTTTAITALSADQFTVGSSINTNGAKYGFVAIKAATGSADDYFAYGSYTGNGSDNQYVCLSGGNPQSSSGSCTSPGWSPDMVMVVKGAASPGNAPAWRSSTMTGDSTGSFGNTANASDMVQDYGTNYFQIGTYGTVNTSGAPYYWFALKNLTNAIQLDTYTGNGTDSRNISPSTNQFQPDFVWTKSQNNVVAYTKFAHQDNIDISQHTLTSALANVIQDFNSSGFQVGSDTASNANTVVFQYLMLKTRTSSNASTLNQSAYRFFYNTDETNVSDPLANQDTAITSLSQGNPFRLRMGVTVGTEDLPSSQKTLKLQIATKSGTCDTGFSGETYADVSDSSGAIRFYNNTTPTDDAAATSNANDPVVSGHTKVMQTYNESSGFNNVNAIPNGQDGVWDMSLIDDSASAGTSYCFRIVNTDNSLLNTYSVIPEITTSPSGSISITTPVSYQVFQRNGSNQGTIAITGTYTGSPSSIEARFNGGSWSTVSASPTGGTFSGNLTGQSPGQGLLEVRFTNATSVYTAKTLIGVGDIYLIVGDSNASGRGISNQSYSHATLKASMYTQCGWTHMVDPTDTHACQTPFVHSTYDDTVGGSVWPLLATKIMADQNVPVAFIPTARGGSGIKGPASYLGSSWQRNITNVGYLYGDMYARVNSMGGVIKGAIFFEAINDYANVSDASTRATYKSHLNTFVNDIYSDFGVKTMFSLPGDCDPGISSCYPAGGEYGYNNVRQAIREVWSTNSNILVGPNTIDINKSDDTPTDGVHYIDTVDLQKVADRMWPAIKTQWYSGSDDYRGPYMTAVEHNAAKTQVYVTFNEGSGPITPASGAVGFKVKDNGTPVTISSVSRINSTKMQLNLASAATGTITASLCEYRDCVAQTTNMVRDASSLTLPAEPFIDQVSSLSGGDITAPTGSVSVNGGASTTNNLNSTLTISATDDVDPSGSLQMMISNDSGFSGASWEAYATSKAWTLTSGTGAKTVYIKFKDSSNNTSGSYSDGITVTDDTAPTGSVSINSGASTTNNLNSTLTISATDDFDSAGSLEMMISNDSGFSGASWEAYATSKAWTLSSGTGSRTVYVRFKDSVANTSGSYSDSITVADNTAPTGSVSINSGDATTNSLNVTLTLSATDDFDSAGSLEMMISNDSGFSGASWEAYATSKAWTLTSGTGAKTVYAKFRDASLNASGSYNDAITVVDTTAPTGSISINSGATSVNISSVTLTLSATDNFDSAGSLEMIVSNESDFADADWESFAASKSWTLASGVGTRTVHVKFRDSTSNQSVSYDDAIERIEDQLPGGGNNDEDNGQNESSDSSNQADSSAPFGDSSSPISDPVGQINEALENIVLNDYDEFFGSNGYQREVKPGEKLYFKLSEQAPYDEHSITIEEVGEDSVTVVIASEPITLRLKLGETKLIDVDKNKLDDISIKLQSITDGKASLLIRRLAVASAAGSTAKPPASATTTKNYPIWLIVVAIGAGSALLVSVVAILKKVFVKKIY